MQEPSERRTEKKKYNQEHFCTNEYLHLDEEHKPVAAGVLVNF